MKKIILDTDLGSDCDDSLALAILNKFHNEGKCALLAVMSNIADKFSPVAIQSINEFYGNSDIPLSQTNGDIFKDSDRVEVYTKHLAAGYLKEHTMPVVEDSISLYRKILSQETNIEVISIGFLNNLCELLKSSPDEISPLNGAELFEKSVTKVYVMGGNFSGNEKTAEYNIRIDPESAIIFSRKCPVPVVYLGWEVGIEVLTGHTLWQSDARNPVKKAYEIFADYYKLTNPCGTYDRQSWDPLTVYYGLTNDALFMHECKNKTITFDSCGYTKVTDGGKDSYIVLDDAKKAEEIIENLII